MTTTDLETRLAALEARAPGGHGPSPLPSSQGGSGARRRGGLFAPIAIAPILVLVLAATAAAGGAIVSGLVQGFEGVENPGQPLHGADLECMSPPEAATYLAEHGFTDVVWQVETGSTGKGDGSTTNRSAPPQHGYVIPGAILSDGQLHMIVDQREGATGVGACYGDPMP
jgi:hypothetical protein